MLFQGEADVIFIVSLIIGTILVTLFMYLAVRAIETKHKASDKKLMILLAAFLAVFLLPIIAGAIGQVLGAIGGILATLRNTIYSGGMGGQDYLSGLVPIIYFLMLFIVVKYLVDIKWENSVWVSLLTLFLYYILLSLVPELATFANI